MLTEKQLKIIGIFKKDLFTELTFSELKKQLRESSNSKLQRTLSNFKKEGLTNIKKIGKSNLISLNYANNKLFDYFSIFNLELYRKNIPLSILYEIQDSVLRETEFFCLIVFGSFVEGKATKKSDLDVAVIVENQEIKKKIIPRVNLVKRKSLKEIDAHIFTREEFLEMLGDEKENLGKQIARNHFVFYGMINFYKLMLRGNAVLS